MRVLGEPAMRWLVSITVIFTWISPATGIDHVDLCTKNTRESSDVSINTVNYPTNVDSNNCSCTITARRTITLKLHLKFQSDGTLLTVDTCSPMLYVEKSGSLPYFVCHNAPPVTEMLPRRSSYTISLLSPPGLRSAAQINLAAQQNASSSPAFSVSCGPVTDQLKRERILENCVCVGAVRPARTPPVPISIHGGNISQRILIGVLTVLAFLVVVGIVAAIYYYMKRRKANKERPAATGDPVSGRVRVPRVSTNPAGSMVANDTKLPLPESNGDLDLKLRTASSTSEAIYSQIRPLQAGGDAAFKGSTDSGLSGSGVDLDSPGYYSLKQEMHPGYASITPAQEMQPRHSRADPHRPPSMAPIASPEDINALYSQPNKLRGRVKPPASPYEGQVNNAYLQGSKDKLNEFDGGEDNEAYSQGTPDSSIHAQHAQSFSNTSFETDV